MIQSTVTKIIINLSPCNSSSFTCDNGVCDQGIDCQDLSDEKNCNTVLLDEENYVREIGEIGMVLRSQFKLYIEWFDERLTFYNLHEGKVYGYQQ